MPEISIHAPRVGSDADLHHVEYHLGDFYPRSPRGERLVFMFGHSPLKPISIHAPRVGSDSCPGRDFCR